MAVKYLAGDRLIGTAAERAALSGTTPTAIPQTSWKELARTTLGSSGDTIDSGTFTAKDNLMILSHYIGDGNIRSTLRFNSDTGSNYATRDSENGGNDSTATSGSYIKQSGSVANDHFNVAYIKNISNKEKLVISYGVPQGSTGAGTAPQRMESVGKWANTSAQITSVQAYNDQGGSYNTGSEIVVLGCDDDEADSGTNFWQELDSSDATGSSYDTGVGGITAKKYLWMEMLLEAGSDHQLRFNDDSGGNYARRTSHNGATDATAINQAANDINVGQTITSGEYCMYQVFIVNVASKEKLIISHGVINEVIGTGTAPERVELVGKWANTSDQITQIQLDGSASYTKHNVRVWGSN